MIGLSFIAFMILDRSALSYIVVNTLMLGACGVCDLFWWSILGEMLDLSANPAKIFGIGLSANVVVGVLIGGLIGKFSPFFRCSYSKIPWRLALAVVLCDPGYFTPCFFGNFRFCSTNRPSIQALSVMPPDRPR